jgi:hypothetical protein
LVAWWKFDETSGAKVADSAGSGYDGTVVHGKPVWDPDGKHGRCLNFDETYGFSIPKEVFSSIDKAITISVWVYGNQRQRKHSDVILQAGVGDAGKPYIVSIYTDWLDYGLKFATGIGEPDRLEFNPGTPEDWTGRWNHYAFVKDADAGFQRIYLNGRLVADQTGTTASMAGVGAARIGIAPDRFGDQYIGKLDDLRIYNYAFSAEEIQQLCGVSPGFGPPVEPVEPAPPIGFGPAAGGFGVQARAVLYDVDERYTRAEQIAIDLDSMKEVRIPAYVRQMEDDEKKLAWLAESGADVVGEIAGMEPGLIGFDLAARLLSPQEWNTTLSALRSFMAGFPSDKEMYMMSAARYQPVFAFRTRENGLGLLQILDADISARRIEFRYKMLQEEEAHIIGR